MRNDLIVKKSKMGLGVFARRDIKSGEVICFLKGKKRKSYAPALNGWMGRSDPSLMNLLQIGQDLYVDLGKPLIYINHSCDPNCGIRGKGTLFAFRSIKKGEEITYDYSTTVDETFECQCGAKHCRRFIPVDFWGLSAARQRYYVRRGALPRYILKRYKKLYGK